MEMRQLPKLAETSTGNGKSFCQIFVPLANDLCSIVKLVRQQISRADTVQLYSGNIN